MGEAIYYLKADNCTKYNFYKIEKFIKEGIEAEPFWQESRGIYNKPEMPKAQFWCEFRERFPVVSKYLKSINKFGGDHNNELAGVLDFGSDDDDLENLEFDLDYKDDNNEEVGQIKYSARVWHFADWTGFTKFLQSEFKVTNARWISDEDIDPNDVF